MSEMHPRRQAILAIVVQEYVATAQPVGSKTVAEGYGLNVSSATIRNEMKALEERGYLTHPHTSAGRIPTEEGYRYFVEHLLAERPISMADQRLIQHQFYQVRQEFDQWAQLAAAVLAHTARMAALATPLRADRCRFKHIELVEVRNGLALLVLVLQQGMVTQQMLSIDYSVNQYELSQLSNQLNDLLAGLLGDEIRTLSPSLSTLGHRVLEVIQTLMDREDNASAEHVYREGLAHILDQPEFANPEDVQQVVSVLEQPPLLGTILEGVRQQDGVQVLIGGEGRHSTLRDVSLVLSRYGAASSGMGVLGIVGPVRMPYGQNIPLVRYVAQVLSSMVSEWYAP